ncbi:MAG: folylpolyglutamate synthase/dihydrofolate synthase family protein [Rhodospirillales bacterium]|nr:folylpolyglutamate synthase/dihydrofolate synthase family protein [Rhodospirillales bacterium]
MSPSRSRRRPQKRSPPRRGPPRKRKRRLNSDPVLDRLTRLHPKLIDLSLERVETLLERLGRPHEQLPPVVHVAGTNGKGSVVAFLRAILEAAGYRVHAYTSPHLVRFNERIRVAGRLIEDDHLTALLEECERVNGGAPVTFFEITTAAAMLAFARTPADITLLETGLGGRLDATNAMPRPRLSVITPISMDHQQYLGDTLEKIAGEKAGIMKAGVPCLTAAQGRKVLRVLERQAAAKGAPLAVEGADWFVLGRGEGLLFCEGDRSLALPRPRLPGKHQVQNAGLAVACARRLAGFAIPDAAIGAGLERVEWPARLQRLTAGPLPALLPEGWELWLDGGHNPGAGRALAEHFRHWRDRPLHLVFGMLNTKDPIGYLKPMAPAVTRLRAVAIPGEANALAADEAALAAGTVAIAAAAAPGVEAAIRELIAADPRPARILICGSLYLAGTVLRDNA